MGITPTLPDMIAVLVLDDLRFDRHKLDRLCAKLPIKCEVAQSECLSTFNRQLDNGAFDLILVDYDLPVGTGLDALEMIQLSPRNCNAVSIMVTGIDEDSIALEAMTRGCADYITKNRLTPASFERAVTNALHKSILTTEARSQNLARQEVEVVLNRFASQCIGDIKPMVSRMIRQLRALRDTPDHNTQQLHENRDSVETTCLGLWEFLEQLEGEYAKTTMSDFLQVNERHPSIRAGESAAAPGSEHQIRAPKAVRAPQRKRPPSPFSRTTQ